MNTRGHLTSETIDLLMMSGLDATKSQAAHAHLGTCDFCKKRWDELNEDKARFEQFVFPRTVEKLEARIASPSLLERLREGWKVLVPVAGAALAASLALGLMVKGTGGEGTQTEDDIYIGTKGAAAGLEVVASRAALGQFPVKPGSVLFPKDRIRFLVNPAGAKYVLIASRDGQGAFTVYHPFGGTQSVKAEPGFHEVPGSVELDESLGTERLVAIFSQQPVTAEAVKAALAANPAAPTLPDARVVTWEFLKQRP